MTKPKEPAWLTLDGVLAAHDNLLDEHGGQSGVRDQGLLETALHRPLNKFYFEEETDMCTLAAAYCYALATLHPFLDGNKRMAYMASVMFLLKNKQYHKPNLAEARDVMIALAQRKVDEETLANWFQQNSKKP